MRRGRGDATIVGGGGLAALPPRRVPMTARDLFLLEHAHLHAAEVSGDPRVHSLEDGLLSGLSDADLRARPQGLNSIAWLLWHVTRFEDVAINAVLRDAPEVLDREGWAAQLGVG